VRALAHQPSWRLGRPRKLQRIRFIIFARAGLTRSCSTPGRRFVWVVAELAGHGNDASTEEKRAARERVSVNKISGKFV